MYLTKREKNFQNILINSFKISTKARRLYRYDLKPNHFVIMDDEKYFTFSSAEGTMNFGFCHEIINLLLTILNISKKRGSLRKFLYWWSFLNAEYLSLHYLTIFCFYEQRKLSEGMYPDKTSAIH